MKKRLLFLGDIVGEPGLGYLETTLPELTHRLAPDFIIANAENLDLTTPERGGCGMRPESLGRLWALGVDVVTGGTTIPSIPLGLRRSCLIPESSAP